MKYTLGERIRRLFEDPFERMREVGAASGLKVADVGAGKGFFTVAAAELVGEGGFVFAVEPDPDRIKIIRRRCDEARLTNIRFLEKKAEEMNQIDAESLDLVFSMYALHHFESLERGLSEIRRILKPGGRFYAIDIMKGRIFRHGSKRARPRSPCEVGIREVRASRPGEAPQGKTDEVELGPRSPLPRRRRPPDRIALQKVQVE